MAQILGITALLTSAAVVARMHPNGNGNGSCSLAAYELYQDLSGRSPEALRSQAQDLLDQSRPAEAIPLLQSVLAIEEARFGPQVTHNACI